MFVWQKRVSARWLAMNESQLNNAAGSQLAIIQSTSQRTALIEVASPRKQTLAKLQARFGGAIKALPEDWLSQTQRQKTKPIKIGKRLTVVRSSAQAVASGSRRLMVPAGAAFGTGEHVTTAMSLRLLEEVSRKFSAGWSMLDLGTGSGILALAAAMFGAGEVVAIDLDPMAIRTAEANARSNRIRGIIFKVADVQRFPMRRKFDVVTANLFGELLIQTLPRLRRQRLLILSGILHLQHADMARAVRQNGFTRVTIRRRGKWIALIAA